MDMDNMEELLTELVHTSSVHWFMFGALMALLNQLVPDFKTKMIQVLQTVGSSHPNGQEMLDDAIRHVAAL
jgi:hypothetical protein